MNEYEYLIEINAIKSLIVKADTQEDADAKAITIITTETIPVTQEDITSIEVVDSYEYDF